MSDTLTAPAPDNLLCELREATSSPPERSGTAQSDDVASGAGIEEAALTTDVPSTEVPSKEGERDKFVVMLPGGWRVAESPVQWIVQSPMKSGWKNAAFHIQRDALIRQLPERLWGPRSGRALPDDVLAVLRALLPFHPGEGKDAELAKPADAPSRKVRRNATRMSSRADRKRRS